MGRTHVIIADEVIRKVDKVAGARGRSRYLEEAAREKLERDELLEALKDSAGIASAEDYPEWKDDESIAAWVRRGRGHSDGA
jgi:metal-responsive CopG/Arc/MetJ family transcriptional regulator